MNGSCMRTMSWLLQKAGWCATQRTLFPVTFRLLSAQDAVLLQELLADLAQLGFLVEPFGKNSFVIQGTPADLPQGNEKACIESLIEQVKHFSSDIKFSKREKLIRSMAVPAIDISTRHCVVRNQKCDRWWMICLPVRNPTPRLRVTLFILNLKTSTWKNCLRVINNPQSVAPPGILYPS